MSWHHDDDDVCCDAWCGALSSARSLRAQHGMVALGEWVRWVSLSSARSLRAPHDMGALLRACREWVGVVAKKRSRATKGRSLPAYGTLYYSGVFCYRNSTD
jgi:hypothetical protein